MAEEEKMHEQFLNSQFKHYEEKGKFQNEDFPNEEEDGITNMVLSEKTKESIEAASFEAAGSPRSRSIESVPTAGPIASGAKAHCHPTRSTNTGTN